MQARTEFKATMQVHSALNDLAQNGWDLPLNLIRSRQLPLTAFKEYEVGVVWAEINPVPNSPFVEVTFSWPGDVNAEKTAEVIRRLQEKFG